MSTIVLIARIVRRSYSICLCRGLVFGNWASEGCQSLAHGQGDGDDYDYPSCSLWLLNDARPQVKCTLIPGSESGCSSNADRCAIGHFSDRPEHERSTLLGLIESAGSFVTIAVDEDACHFEPPFFLSSSPTSQPYDGIVTVNLRVNTLFDLPDIRENILTVHELEENSPLRQAYASFYTDERFSAVMRDFAISTSPEEGMWLPVEVEDGPSSKLGALRLIKKEPNNVFRAHLLLHDQPANISNSKLVRSAPTQWGNSPPRFSALIADVVSEQRTRI